MKYKISVPVTTEPITMAEAKTHIRLTTNTFAGDVETNQSISPGVHIVAAAYSLEGSAVDVLGTNTIVNLNSGANGTGASVVAKIQESDDNLTWQDFTGGGFTTVTEANDNAVQEIGYTGVKQYIRVVATVAVDSCSFSADVITETGYSVEDDLLSSIITTSREYCENITGRALAPQTVETYLDCFPSVNYIELPLSPLTSVTSVIYTDSDGNETTLTEGTDYLVDTDSPIGRIVLPYGGSWASFTPYPINPITITHVSGYTASNLIPKSLKQAMLLLIGHWYENREAVMVGAINMTKKIEYAVDAMTSIYRIRWW